MPTTDESSARAAPKLVIVSGAGRSGTSTVAGTLSHLGFHVPKPEVQANKANPRGHFEPRWVVDFHARMMNMANVALMDSRPDAAERVAKVAERPEFRDELRDWLSGQLEHRQLVVKDPRAFWCRDLWLDTASALGVDTSFLTMLRHPAEVVGSRDMHYFSNRTDDERAILEISNLAEWVNASVLNEWTSRGHRHVFVRYTDLLQDWRDAMGRVSRVLGLALQDALTVEHHPVDDFIDVTLHRAKVTWADLVVPHELRDQAEDVWQLLSHEHGPEGLPAEESARLDDIRETYRRRYQRSEALVRDHTEAAERMARWQTQKKLKARAEQAEARAKDAEAQLSTMQAQLVQLRAKAPGSASARTRRVARRVVGRARTLRRR